MIQIVALIVLTLICAALIVERYFYVKEMNAKNSELLNAILARNMSEFISAKAVDKITPQPMVEPDEVPLDTADDKVFDKFINSQQWMTNNSLMN